MAYQHSWITSRRKFKKTLRDVQKNPESYFRQQTFGKLKSYVLLPILDLLFSAVIFVFLGLQVPKWIFAIYSWFNFISQNGFWKGLLAFIIPFLVLMALMLLILGIVRLTSSRNIYEKTDKLLENVCYWLTRKMFFAVTFCWLDACLQEYMVAAANTPTNKFDLFLSIFCVLLSVSIVCIVFVKYKIYRIVIATELRRNYNELIVVRSIMLSGDISNEESYRIEKIMMELLDKKPKRVEKILILLLMVTCLIVYFLVGVNSIALYSLLFFVDLGVSIVERYHRYESESEWHIIKVIVDELLRKTY